jgi:arylsulfatase A-like enzyme
MFEWSAKIPMILMPAADYARTGHHKTDDRLVCLRDVMPTLLDLCGLEIPSTVEGLSMIGEKRRSQLLCEHHEDARAMRMLRTKNCKLIWYPVGNRFQLFDLSSDPEEQNDLSERPECSELLGELKNAMLGELWGSDLEKWVRNGKLAGEADQPFTPSPNRGLLGQRGWR